MTTAASNIQIAKITQESTGGELNSQVAQTAKLLRARRTARQLPAISLLKSLEIARRYHRIYSKGA